MTWPWAMHTFYQGGNWQAMQLIACCCCGPFHQGADRSRSKQGGAHAPIDARRVHASEHVVGRATRIQTRQARGPHGNAK